MRKRRYGVNAIPAVAGILLHFVHRLGANVTSGVEQRPLWFVLAAGGIPLTLELLVKLLRGQFGSDLLAVVIDGRYAALLMFRDEPRREGAAIVAHLRPNHDFRLAMLVSGDRENKVRYLAERVGIRDVFALQSPEQKLTIVRKETALAKTVYLGDGVNDAPALTAATVVLAFGHNSDVAAEAADVGAAATYLSFTGSGVSLNQMPPITTTEESTCHKIVSHLPHARYFVIGRQFRSRRSRA